MDNQNNVKQTEPTKWNTMPASFADTIHGTQDCPVEMTVLALQYQQLRQSNLNFTSSHNTPNVDILSCLVNVMTFYSIKIPKPFTSILQIFIHYCY